MDGWSIETIENGQGNDQYPGIAGTGNPQEARLTWCTNRDGDSNIYSAVFPIPATPQATQTPVPTANPTVTPTSGGPTETPGSPSATPTQQPPATSTPVPPTPTGEATNTAIPTYTSPPSSTPTPSPTATDTPPEPTYTPVPPSATPTTGFTATATPSPTPAPQEFTFRIETNQSDYRPGDTFTLACYFRNTDLEITLDEYVMLDVYGSYWFWPGWKQTVDFRSVAIPVDENWVQPILEFTWPEQVGSAEGLMFWGAVLVPGTSQLYCDYSSCSFSYTE